MSQGTEGEPLTGAYPSSGISRGAETPSDPFGPDTSEDVYSDPFSSSTTVRPTVEPSGDPVSTPTHRTETDERPASYEDPFGIPAEGESGDHQTFVTSIPRVDPSAGFGREDRPGADQNRTGSVTSDAPQGVRNGSSAYTPDVPEPRAEPNSLSAATQGSGVHDAERIAATRTAPQDIFRNTQDLSDPAATRAHATPYAAEEKPDAGVSVASYPSAEAAPPVPRGGRRGFGLRRMIQSENLPTAPMRVVERLANSPFANPRRFKERTEVRRTLNFSLRLAETMFHFGADSRDVETAIVATCATYGVEDVDVDITNQSVIINYISESDGTKDSPGVAANSDEVFSHTVVRVVRSWSDNYAGLTETHRLVKRITNGDLSRAEAERRLARILSKPKPYPRWLVNLCNSSAAGVLTVGIGGTWLGAIVSFLTFTVVQFMAGKLAAWRIPSFFTMAACSALVTLIAMVLYALGAPVSPAHIVGSGLIMLLPTLTLVSTIQDAINGFPVTSAGRLIATGLSFTGLIVGIAIAVSITTSLGFREIEVDSVVFSGAEPLVNIVFMLIATALIAITVQVKPRHILPGVFSSFCGLAVFHLFALAGAGGRMTSMLGAIGVGCASALIAQRHLIPQVVLAVPGLTFLLPGLTIFRGMYTLTVNIDPVTGLIPMLNAGAIIMSMAASVVLGNYLMRPFMSKDPETRRKLVRRRKQEPDPLGN
ncbi:threonine/serine exporter family protein [Curtobacterium sp. S6]|uniref:threonine/serine exporter family protein n=1 Tax=Curtobacterium sp. S6 TaxID=1479623 RepID=UPI00068F4F50|nr:threonine/serine exporter family protein [Curtobacterium sp. S6]